MRYYFLIMVVALIVSCERVNKSSIDNDDKLTRLLDELDECKAEGNHERCFRLYSKISKEYEAKNLISLQKHYQRMMQREAESVCESDSINGHVLLAEALQRLATTYMVEGKTDSAAILAHRTYNTIRKDTLDFRAQTLLLIAQIHLMKENGDSVLYYTKEAERIYPNVVRSDLYRITHAYGLDLQNKTVELMSLLPAYISKCDIHGKAELMRLQMYCHEDNGQWHAAYDDAVSLMEITDSIAKVENSVNMGRIHALQHERQMETMRAEREAERAWHYVIIIAVLVLLLAATSIGLIYRRNARNARAHELEAMRLSEGAKAKEEMVREENLKLQRLYYEHLYAIILPVLNSNRAKSGHINLEEKSWELIEKNTDMVLPNFTTRLRKHHPTLTTEEVRFCCLLMMRVPNALMADIYGIAPSSVSVRKQRMKKKLDGGVQNQTIELYLNKYVC